MFTADVAQVGRWSDGQAKSHSKFETGHEFIHCMEFLKFAFARYEAVEKKLSSDTG